MKSFTICLLSIFFSGFVFAQEKGFVRGNIADGDFGGPLIGAAVTVEELPGVGTTTDFDGNFSLPLEPGTYTVNISFISYKTQKFPSIIIKPGEVSIIDATLASAAEELATVEIVAEVRRNNDVAMLMEMKKASNVTDGISSQSFRKIGDSDLGGAIKRVTGVTVQGGKYVYVRGLGDRYTKTTLNGMAIPGLDPDVNAVQIDIFPTSVLENVQVYKTFSPDLYGDFTGGLVNVVTKKFPDEKSSNITFGLGVTPGMHFNSEYLSYAGGNLDWAGYAGKRREIPLPITKDVPSEVLVDPELESITRSFDPVLAAQKTTALPNGSFSFNHGNQINREDGSTIGYNTVFNYRNQRVFYRDFENNYYLKSNNKDENELGQFVGIKGDVGRQTVLWSGLVSGSYKKGNNSFSATLLNSQSGESSAAKRNNQDFDQTGATLREDILTYTSRTLTNFTLSGKHLLAKNMELSWANAATYSKVYDPDFRETKISTTQGDTSLNTGDGAGIDRFWRFLDEFNESFRADLKIPVGDNMEIKTGGFGMIKTRDFDVANFKHRVSDQSNISIDPDWFLASENVWSADDKSGNFRNGTYTVGSFQKQNSFTSSQTQFAGYLMAQNQLFGLFKFIYGVRVEKTDMFYSGTNNSETEVYNNEKTLDAFNILPSLNIVYSLTEDMNLRLAANQTVAMPSFKEISIAQIYDPITKRTYVGNLDLEQTTVMNFDLRYEYFFAPKELLSVAGFYKQFDGHIELISNNLNPDEFKPRNSGKAELMGVEFELRKGLPNATSFLNNFFLSTNVSLVQSAVDLKSVLINNAGETEYDSRAEFLRTGEKLNDKRPMAGQSPYAVNVNLAYELAEKQINFALAYNVQGEQLTIIGSERVPDVYTLPFHSVNFNTYKGFGKDFNQRITLRVQNILNDDQIMVYRAYNAEDKVFNRFYPGINFNIKYSYNF